MCSLENEIESQMGEFHVKMKGESLFTLTQILPSISPLLISWLISDVSGLAGFARLCAGDQYEVRHTLMSSPGQIPTLCFPLLAAALSAYLCLALIGADEVWAAALEATRPCGGQQQADMGQ